MGPILNVSDFLTAPSCGDFPVKPHTWSHFESFTNYSASHNKSKIREKVQNWKTNMQIVFPFWSRGLSMLLLIPSYLCASAFKDVENVSY